MLYLSIPSGEIGLRDYAELLLDFADQVDMQAGELLPDFAIAGDAPRYSCGPTGGLE